MWKSKGRIGALIDASLDVEHSRHAALYASQALAQLILHAPNSTWRESILQAGVLNTLLAMAERDRVDDAPDPPTAEGADAARVFERRWRDELRGLSARALLDLSKRDAARVSLVSDGALFKWMELAAEPDTRVVRLAIRALQNVSESEEPVAACSPSPACFRLSSTTPTRTTPRSHGRFARRTPAGDREQPLPNLPTAAPRDPAPLPERLRRAPARVRTAHFPPRPCAFGPHRQLSETAAPPLVTLARARQCHRSKSRLHRPSRGLLSSRSSLVRSSLTLASSRRSHHSFNRATNITSRKCSSMPRLRSDSSPRARRADRSSRSLSR